MANPIFNNSPVFQDPVQRKGQKSPTSTVSYGTPGPQVADAATLDQMYDAPAATTRETGRLTYDDVIMKTAGLLAVLVVTGAATWVLAPGLWIFGAIVGLVLGLVNAFKKEPSPPLILLYAAAQGVFLGGLSSVLRGAVLRRHRRPGGPRHALGVRGLARSCSSPARSASRRSSSATLLIAMVGYLVFSLINVVSHAVRDRRGRVRPAAVRLARCRRRSHRGRARGRDAHRRLRLHQARRRGRASRPSSRGRRRSVSS